MPILPFLAPLLAKALPKAGLTVAVTLTKVTPGDRSSASPLDGTSPTWTDYACKGLLSQRTAGLPGGSSTTESNRVVAILGGTLPAGVEPMPGDRVTIEGAIHVITGNVDRDPAAAVYSCTLRGL